MLRGLVRLAACSAATVLGAGGFNAALAQPQLKATPIATGLAYPLYVTAAPGDNARLFIIEQRGKIKVVNVSSAVPPAYSVRTTPLIDITSQIGSTYLEYGVLGLAFHPQFASNGYFYVTHTAGSLGDWVLLRFRIPPLSVNATWDQNVADISSQKTILRFTYTLGQHRGGWIGFGPDGYLYATTGDGGEQDPLNAASNLGLLRGKVLRLDVNGPDGLPDTADDDGFPADPLKNYVVPATNPFVSTAGAAPEIWAYGFRNPWRASFDRQTGDMWIGDVGQSAREEVDMIPAGVGGLFFGWRCKEGNLSSSTSLYPECVPPLTPSVAPMLDYPRSAATVSGSSVTGGYVYRGCAMPSFRGHYFFGDWTGKTWTAVRSDGGAGNTLVSPSVKTVELGSPGSNVSFGEDNLGELYFCNWNATTGSVLKIEPRTLDTAGGAVDCNGNARSDACDIALGLAAGGSADANGNGIPDECDCRVDFDHSGTVATADIFVFLNAWFQGEPRTDFNHVGGITTVDILDFLTAWLTGC